ncbi:glyceraldehyde 3-phosphate dehydrogenase NAD-binding domain-containing protein [Candidatus Pelagibacter sp. HIMB1623]|uniref:glyceraldehyde 3-phosphate dehydrogenase NAD-binding domain-containing protein n=1 Tax=Candidatus Pelagibacter sp. HIMB1623 TaxID=3413358 RepID=UPI003F84B91E
MRIAINGAGRIGRCLIRKIILDENLKLTHINDPYLTPDSFCYLLNYDSIYGSLKNKIKKFKKNQIIFGKKKIIFTRHQNLYNNKFSKDLDIVIDSSGIKENHNQLQKLIKKNNLKGIITHTYEKSDIQIIFGVNENKFNYKKHHLVSSSICDAVAIGPILNLINNNFKINNGSILTLHPWLGYQNLVDGPSRSFAYPGEIVENFSLGRASTEALISKKTSCVNAIENVMPGMLKKISSMSFRVPTQIVSSAYIYLTFKDKIDLNKLLFEIKNFIKNQKYKIFMFNKDQCISKDFIENEYSTIIDERWIEIKNNNLRILVWYDNEFGYSSRVIDLIRKM